MQQIAEAIGMDITTFSRQIQNLIKMNLVKKTPLTSDKRVYIISFTVEGTFVTTTIDEMINNYLNEVFSNLNEFEKETVLRSIELLNNALSKSNIDCTSSS